MSWIHYLLIAFETFGFFFFFDSFFDLKDHKRLWIRYPLLYISIIAVILVLQALFPKYGDVVKVLFVILTLIVLCCYYYQATIMVAVFFSVLNYILLFFVDCAAVSLFGMQETSANHILWIGLRLLWITLLVIIRKTVPHIKRYLRQDRIVWTRFAWLPLFSGVVGVYFYIFFLSSFAPNAFYSIVSIGLICLNTCSLFFLQDSLLKEEKLFQSEAQLQKKQNQIRVFHDMQSLYERQGKKLHDYKKQLITIQGLIESNDTESAINLAKNLTKTIEIEMSEVNTGHSVVNAILNQEYRIAKGIGIGMIFSLSDASDIKLSDEDIVIVFGNLLDNAIHECERIVNAGSDAAISVKLAKMGNEMIITIQNPVSEKVVIEDNEIVTKNPSGHGIGLVNVRETVEKYDGSIALSCDEKEFTAVVII